MERFRHLWLIDCWFHLFSLIAQLFLVDLSIDTYLGVITSYSIHYTKLYDMPQMVSFYDYRGRVCRSLRPCGFRFEYIVRG